MQGMLFVILDNGGNVVNHGVIAKEITPEKYLCQFQVKPIVSRIVSIEELQTYNLFANGEQRNEFLRTIQEQAKTPETPPAKNGDNKKKTGKKAKKKSRNK